MADYIMLEDGDLYCEFLDLRIYPEMLEPGHQLRLKRVHDGLTLAALAAKLGVSIGTLSNYENGKRDIPRGRQKAFHSYLHLEWIMDGQLIDIIEEAGDDNG